MPRAANPLAVSPRAQHLSTSVLRINVRARLVKFIAATRDFG